MESASRILTYFHEMIFYHHHRNNSDILLKYKGMGRTKVNIYDKANLRDLIAATGLVILLKFDPNHRFFSPCDLEIWCMTSKTRQIWGIWKLWQAYSSETPNLGQNRWCFVPCDLDIRWMTLENNRASLLCCLKLCATFHNHRWIQTGVTVRKCPIWVKIDHF